MSGMFHENHSWLIQNDGLGVFRLGSFKVFRRKKMIGTRPFEQNDEILISTLKSPVNMYFDNRILLILGFSVKKWHD